MHRNETEKNMEGNYAPGPYYDVLPPLSPFASKAFFLAHSLPVYLHIFYMHDIHSPSCKFENMTKSLGSLNNTMCNRKCSSYECAAV